MNRFTSLAAVAVTACVAASVIAGQMAVPPKIGQRAPDFTLMDQNGRRVSLAEARGEKAVLVFYRGYW